QNSFIMDDFITDVEYCFIVRANLEGGTSSTSNKACILTKMQRPPQWINADYATVNAENNISLSFTIDPLSEITHFRLERKVGISGSFKEIAQTVSVNGSVSFTDDEADVNLINYYRLAAINNCNTAITFSNLSSNMVLALERIGDDFRFSWNSYKEWLGMISSYRLFINTGRGFEEKILLQPTDTVFILNYHDIMFEVTGEELCFYIVAIEAYNPNGITGQSLSSRICTVPKVLITVPNIFTPNSGTINSYFRPILSFIPLNYHLIISDRRGNILFETKNYSESWNGSQNGNPQPEGVCLWFLKLTAPTGDIIAKTGTITIINKR
ncbi:MAG: gliding motility-associated C-terminal domain-containing protein, partial [Bacteroidales bacterium]|nr:gliding motility-associated C-terminal domain-containing protein [Bacteroidales bacterium]